MREHSRTCLSLTTAEQARAFAKHRLVSHVAAPEQLPSVLGAIVEAGISSEQTDELGGPEGSVGCRATKAFGRLSSI